MNREKQDGQPGIGATSDDSIGVMSPPLGSHPSLWMRARKAVIGAMFGFFAVVFGLLLLLDVIDAILHLPFLLLLLAWYAVRDKVRSRSTAVIQPQKASRTAEQAQARQVFGVFVDPPDSLATKPVFVVRTGELVTKSDGSSDFEFPSEEGSMVEVFFWERHARAAVRRYEGKESWLYVHRYRVGFLALLGTAAITVPWAHYANHAAWRDTPMWVLAIWFFIGAVLALVHEIRQFDAPPRSACS